MNRSISSWLLLALLTLFACKSSDGLKPSPCRDGRCTYAFVEDAQLSIEEVDEWNVFLRRDSGANLVFTYNYVADDNPRIADDEYSERISFELNPDLTNIALEDGELTEIKLAFAPSCECILEVVEIRSGKISGEKINENQWEFNLDLEFEWAGNPQTRNISGVFERDT